MTFPTWRTASVGVYPISILCVPATAHNSCNKMEFYIVVVISLFQCIRLVRLEIVASHGIPFQVFVPSEEIFKNSQLCSTNENFIILIIQIAPASPNPLPKLSFQNCNCHMVHVLNSTIKLASIITKFMAIHFQIIMTGLFINFMAIKRYYILHRNIHSCVIYL